MVISQLAPTVFMPVPILEMTVAVHRTVKARYLKGSQAEGASAVLVAMMESGVGVAALRSAVDTLSPNRQCVNGGATWSLILGKAVRPQMNANNQKLGLGRQFTLRLMTGLMSRI